MADSAFFSQRGGARTGWTQASWPFASIEVKPGCLTVSVLGKYTFAPSQVDAVEPVGSIPLLSTGIRIHHTRSDYPEKIVFFGLGGRDRLLAAISAAGFRVGEPAFRHERGFPVKISAIVVFILVWNALFWLDAGGDRFNTAGGRAGPYSCLALALTFAAATLILRSPRAQGLVLREGHDVGEIRGTLRLVQIIAGLGTLISAISLNPWAR